MKHKIIVPLLGLLSVFGASAQQKIESYVGVFENGSTGDYAPYFIGSLNGGRINRQSSIMTMLGAKVDFDEDKRFAWAAGAEIIGCGGDARAIEYDRWNVATNMWTKVSNSPAAFWIQQLYGELKYRGVFIRVGQKDYKSALLDETLS